MAIDYRHARWVSREQFLDMQRSYDREAQPGRGGTCGHGAFWKPFTSITRDGVISSAGKSTLNGGFMRKITKLNSVSSSKPCLIVKRLIIWKFPYMRDPQNCYMDNRKYGIDSAQQLNKNGHQLRWGLAGWTGDFSKPQKDRHAISC